MARISRKCYESSYFHIMVQGIEKRFIFNTAEFKEKYYEIIRCSTEKNNVKIISFCIMDNHVHLLLYTEKINNITKVMLSTNTRFAKFYNKRLNRCGYVFRDRYRCENIMTQNHLINCIKYIHNNPIQAKICKKQSNYKYSSYNLYKNNLIEEDIVKLIFGNLIEYNFILDENVEDYNYIEVENEFGEKKYEDINKVVKEFKCLDVTDKKTMYYAIKELKNRCNAKNEDIARVLNIKRSSFYRILKKFK